MWSYGVTLWEMFSYGEPPYGDMTGAEVRFKLAAHQDPTPAALISAPLGVLLYHDTMHVQCIVIKYRISIVKSGAVTVWATF